MFSKVFEQIFQADTKSSNLALSAWAATLRRTMTDPAPGPSRSQNRRRKQTVEGVEHARQHPGGGNHDDGNGGVSRQPADEVAPRRIDRGQTIRPSERRRSGNRLTSTDRRLCSPMVSMSENAAAKSLPSVMIAKESVNRAFEVPLAEGIAFERRVFHSLFATEDQKEGMASFVEKRPPRFKNR
jgi:hypothetical protein